FPPALLDRAVDRFELVVLSRELFDLVTREIPRDQERGGGGDRRGDPHDDAAFDEPERESRDEREKPGRTEDDRIEDVDQDEGDDRERPEPVEERIELRHDLADRQQRDHEKGKRERERARDDLPERVPEALLRFFVFHYPPALQFSRLESGVRSPLATSGVRSPLATLERDAATTRRPGRGHPVGSLLRRHARRARGDLPDSARFHAFRARDCPPFDAAHGPAPAENPAPEILARARRDGIPRDLSAPDAPGARPDAHDRGPHGLVDR